MTQPGSLSISIAPLSVRAARAYKLPHGRPCYRAHIELAGFPNFPAKYAAWQPRADIVGVRTPVLELPGLAIGQEGAPTIFLQIWHARLALPDCPLQLIISSPPDQPERVSLHGLEQDASPESFKKLVALLRTYRVIVPRGRPPTPGIYGFPDRATFRAEVQKAIGRVLRAGNTPTETAVGQAMRLGDKNHAGRALRECLEHFGLSWSEEVRAGN